MLLPADTRYKKTAPPRFDPRIKGQVLERVQRVVMNEDLNRPLGREKMSCVFNDMLNVTEVTMVFCAVWRRQTLARLAFDKCICRIVHLHYRCPQK